MNKSLLLAVVAAACSIPVFAGTDFTETNISNLFTDLGTNCPSGGCTVTIPSTATGYLPSSTQNITVPFVTFDCKAGATLAVPSGSNYTAIYVKASHVTFQGCTFDNTNNSQDVMVVVGSGSLTNTKQSSDYFFHTNWVGTSTVAAALNVLANQSNNFEIDDFILEDSKFTYGGIFAHGGSMNGIKFLHNDVAQKLGNTNNTAMAIHTDGAVGAVITNVVISDNVIHDQGQFCTELQAYTGSTIQNVTFTGNDCETAGAGYGTGFSFDTMSHAVIANNTNNSYNYSVPTYVSALEIVNCTDIDVSNFDANSQSGSVTDYGSGISINKSSRVSVKNANVTVGGGKGAMYVGGSVNGTNTDDVTVGDSHFNCVGMTSQYQACITVQNNASTASLERFTFHHNYVIGTSTTNGTGIALQDNGVAGWQSNWELSNNVFLTLNHAVDPASNGYFGDIADQTNRFINLGATAFTQKPTTSTTWHTTAW